MCVLACSHIMHPHPPRHAHAHTFCGLIQFWCSCSPQGAEQDRRFMFSVVQTRFSRLAPHSLELLHGHTCYSNKLNKASLQSLMDSMGGVSSPHCKNPEGDVTIHEAAQQQLISIEAGGGGEKDYGVVQPSIMVIHIY